MDLINNNLPSAPCKGCEKRYVGCHSKCEEYIDYKKRAEEASKLVADKKSFENIFYADKRKVGIKALKQKKR